MHGNLPRIIILTFFLLAFLGNGVSAQIISQFCTNAAQTGSGVPNFTVSVAPIVALALLALVISFDVAAIGYIISKLVPGTQLSAWMRKEFWEIAKSAILIASIYSLIILLGGISTILIGPGVYSQAASSGQNTQLSTQFSALTNSARYYLYAVYCGGVVSTANGVSAPGISQGSVYLTFLSVGAAFVGSINVQYWIPIPIPPVGPVIILGNSFRPYKNSLLGTSIPPATYESFLWDSISLLAVPVSTIVLAEYYILPLLVITGLMLFIPLGIVFRSFPFIRGIGGTLIALGIGLAIVYPTLLVVVDGPIYQMTSTLITSQYGGCTAANGCDIQWYITSALDIFNLGPTQSTGAILNGWNDGLAAYDTSIYALNGLTYYMMTDIMQFLLFIIDLAIAWPIVNTIAKSLGGSINLSLGSKLRII